MPGCCSSKARNWGYRSYIDTCHRRPYLVLGIELGLAILLAAAIIGGGVFGLSEADESPWLVVGHEYTSKMDAVKEAVDRVSPDTISPLRTQTDFQAQINVAYNCKGENCFTDRNLAAIRKFENMIITQPRYSNFCQLASVDGPCRAPRSPVVAAYGPPSADGYSDTAASEDPVAVLAAQSDNVAFFFERDFDAESNPVSTYTRTSFYMGLPVMRADGSGPYANADDETEDQAELIDEQFMEDLDGEILDYLGMTGGFLRTKLSSTGKLPDTDIEVYFNHVGVEEREFETISLLDFSWAFLSFVLVWAYMAFHTRSLMLASFGMLEIVLAIPLAVGVYHLIFQIKYFEFLNLLIVFVMLGIGADDVFVFTDAFKQSELVPSVCGSDLNRLQYTAHRAGKAVTVTSLTTMSAFLITGTSAMMPIAAFGIFASICVYFLYLLNVAMMPCILIIWSRNFEALPCCVCSSRCVNREKLEARQDERAGLAADRANTHTAGAMMQGNRAAATQAEALPEEALKHAHVQEVGNMRRVERLLHGPYFNILRKAKYGFLLLGLLILALSIYFASTIKPPSEAESFLPEYHMMDRFVRTWGNQGPFEAASEDDTVSVSIAWGLKGMNTGNSDRWDADDRGELEFVQAFDPTSQDAQAFLLSVCEAARAEPCEAKGCETDDLVLAVGGDTECWIETFDASLRARTPSQQLPLPPAQFASELLDWYQSPAGASDSTKIGFKVDEASGELTDTVEWLRFELPSTLSPPRSESLTKSVLKEWEAFVDATNERSAALGLEDALGEAFQTGGDWWAWAHSQGVLVKTAVQGVILVLVIAFVVINVATQNVILAAYAIITVMGIVGTTVGFGVVLINDWDLGVTESVAVVVLIGFSMDYCLHLLDAYIESPSVSRADKTRDALTNLGVSILAGAVTTFLAGVTLYGAALVFFTKFAFLICATVVIALLWSMTFLPALLMVLGPEGNQGNWIAGFRAVVSYFKNRKSG